MRKFLFILLSCTVSVMAGYGSEKAHQGHEILVPHADEPSNEANEHKEEIEISSEVGPDNAVTEADPEKGFKLSDPALKTMGIKTKPVLSHPISDLPKEAIVTFQAETGVYRLRDGWFKLIEGKVNTNGMQFQFIPQGKEDIKVGDQIVIHGVSFLRVTELDTFSGSEEGDAH